MGHRGCSPLFPPARCTRRCGGEEGIATPPCGCGCCTNPPRGWIWVRLCCCASSPCPSPTVPRGAIRILLRSESRRSRPPIPHCHPPGGGGGGGELLWRGLPPLWHCPLLHQPEGDALKNIEQPLGEGRGGGLPLPPPPPPLASPHPATTPPTPRDPYGGEGESRSGRLS